MHRFAGPATNAGPDVHRPLPADAGKLLVHVGSRGRLLRGISRQAGKTIVMHRRLRYSCAPVCLRQRDMLVGLGGYRLAKVRKYSSSPRCSAGVLAFAASVFSSFSVGSGAPAPLWNRAPSFGGVAGVPLASFA